MKLSAKNASVLVNGSDFSAYADSYTVDKSVDTPDVTCFSDQAHNFIAGPQISKIGVNFFWDSTATTGVNVKLSALGTGNLTVIPETAAESGHCFSLPYRLSNYNPAGTPADAIKVGTVNFIQDAVALYPYGVEQGVVCAHATITNTTTSGAVYLGALGASTRNISGICHVRIPTSTDTYVITVTHCSSSGGSYATILTFALNGKTLTSERQVASVALLDYIKVTATRTGSGDSLGFTVALWHS